MWRENWIYCCNNQRGSWIYSKLYSRQRASQRCRPTAGISKIVQRDAPPRQPTLSMQREGYCDAPREHDEEAWEMMLMMNKHEKNGWAAHSTFVWKRNPLKDFNRLKKIPHWNQDRQLVTLFLDLDGDVTHSNTKIQKWHEVNEEQSEFRFKHLIYTLVLS